MATGVELTFSPAFERVADDLVWRSDANENYRAQSGFPRLHGLEVDWDGQVRAYTDQSMRPHARHELAERLGVPVDVVEITYGGPFVAQAAPGTRAAHKQVAKLKHFGRVGGEALDSSGAVVVVSNNHVFADCNRGSRGDSIIEPGGAHVASLEQFHPLAPPPTRNQVDAAFATPTARVGSFAPRGLGKVARNVPVRRLDAPHVAGHLQARGAFSVHFPTWRPGGGTLDFRCYSVRSVAGPFSVAGDSGSFVVEGGGAVLGMVLAGHGQVSLICGAAEVGACLGLTF